MKTKLKRVILIIALLNLSIIGFLLYLGKSAQAQMMFGQEGSQFMIRKKVPIGTITPTPNLKVETSGNRRGRMILGKITASQVLPGIFGACCDAEPDIVGVQYFNYYFPNKLTLGTESVGKTPGIRRKLEVLSGDVRINGNIYAVGGQVQFMHNEDNAPRLVKAGSLSIISDYFNSQTAAAGNLYVEGNVGIGTADPKYKLDVTGRVNVKNGGGGGFCISGQCKTLWEDIVGLPPSGTNGETLRHNGTKWVNMKNLYNDGTNVGINITPTPNAKLQVNGTVIAQNHMTSAGYPVNDVLFPQDIWNNSSSPLTGSVMMNTYNWQEVSGPNDFDATSIYYLTSAALTNGNIVLAYNDDWNAINNGAFRIFNSSGTIVKDKTIFDNGAFNDISVTALNNGNFLIAYRDGNNNHYGSYVIYDSAGILVKASTVFASATSSYISATTLTNGNVFIAYNDGSSSSGKFVILDSAGNIIKTPTIFHPRDGAGFMSTSTLPNGNVFLAYYDGSAGSPILEGLFQIFDSNGNQVKGETIFANTYTYDISTATFANGNVMISYRNNSSGDNGTFVIYDMNGNVVKTATVYDSSVGSMNYKHILTALPDGNMFIAWRSSGGAYAIYDSTGNIIKTKTIFQATNAVDITTSTSSDGSVFLAWSLTNSSNKIIRGSASFTKNIAVSGNLGIGTIAPSEKVVVAGVAPTGVPHLPGQIHLEGTSAQHAVLSVKHSTATDIAQLGFANGSNSNRWVLSMRNNFDTPNNRLSLFYYNGSWNEYLTFDPNGTSVGIGLNSPAAPTGSAFKIFEHSDIAGSFQYSQTKIGDMYITWYATNDAFLTLSANSKYSIASGGWVTTNNQPSWKISQTEDMWAGAKTYYSYAAAPAVVGNPPNWVELLDITYNDSSNAPNLYFRGPAGAGCSLNVNTSDGLWICGSIYFSGSSRDFKKNIAPLEVDSNLIYKLRPVSFDFKKEYTNLGKPIAAGRQFGLIAEEVNHVLPELAVSDGKEVRNVDYEKLPVLLLAEIRKNKLEIEQINKEKTEIVAKLADYRQRLNVIKQKKAEKI